MFKTFQQEIDSIAQAGFFDLSSSNVHYDYNENELVIKHEDLHKEFFATTSDGQLFGFLNFAAKNKGFSDVDRENAKTIFDLMYKKSVKTHEALATYLSITDFKAEEHFKLYNTLPKLYKEYYDSIAKYANSVIPTTYLRYTLIHAIGQFSLSSNLYDKIAKNGLDSISDLEKDQQTDYRFQVLFENLIYNWDSGLYDQLVKTIQYALNHVGLEYFDLSIETEWEYKKNGILSEEMYIRKRRLIERMIVGFIKMELVPLCKLSIFNTDEKWYSETEEFRLKYNIVSGAIDTKEKLNDDKYRKAHLASNSKIFGAFDVYEQEPENFPLSYENEIFTILYFDIHNRIVTYVSPNILELEITRYPYFDKSINFKRNFTADKIILVVALPFIEMMNDIDEISEKCESFLPRNFERKDEILMHTYFYISGNLLDYLSYFKEYSIIDFSNYRSGGYRNAKILVFVDNKKVFYFKFFNNINYIHILEYLEDEKTKLRYDINITKISILDAELITHAMGKIIRSIKSF